jgi:methylated-DNA-protein-cysteine methyltransferase-like protein
MSVKTHYMDRVYDVTRQIPRGRVTTYGAIADYLTLGSARMVGWALTQSNYSGPTVPAHRVVNRKGELSGRMHFAGPTIMEQLLQSEGVKVENAKVLDFDQLFWHPQELDDKEVD